MAFDFNEVPLRFFATWPSVFFPLDVSIYGYCQMSCYYCFANRNRDEYSKGLHLTDTTEKLLKTVEREINNPRSAKGLFLRERYPVCMSNTTDPFQREEKNYRATERFLQVAKELRLPIFVQTRGNVLYEEFERYADLLVPGKDAVYISICQLDDSDRKFAEPGAMAIEKRWELAKMLTDRGVPVIAAANPYLKRWIPFKDVYADLCVNAGVTAVYVNHMHHSPAQAKHIPKVYGELVQLGNLNEKMLDREYRQWFDVLSERAIGTSIDTVWDARLDCQTLVWPKEWFGGKLFTLVVDLFRAFIAKANTNDRDYVVIHWQDVEEWCRGWLGKAADDAVNAAHIWVAFNAAVKADWQSFNQSLGKYPSIIDCLRYFWNHPWENMSLWEIDQMAAVKDGDNYAADQNGDLVAAVFNKTQCDGRSTVDWTEIDWEDKPLWEAK